MPLDNTWWDPAGPFADNSVGGITADTMRTFAQEIAEHGVTGSWFKIMFEPAAVTPSAWAISVPKILWLSKTSAFDHSADWTHSQDTSLRDCFSYGPAGVTGIQISFSPSIVVVSHAAPGTGVAPVVSLTVAAAVDPDDTNTHVVGPTSYTTTNLDHIDVGGWATALLANTERSIRFGLKFTPPTTGTIDDGTASFGVDPTGVGASTVSRPLAPAV